MPFIASMGIYVLKASAIKELLTKHFPTKHDFGSDIIPGAKDLGMKIQVSRAPQGLDATAGVGDCHDMISDARPAAANTSGSLEADGCCCAA
jgi:hypothetical protein